MSLAAPGTPSFASALVIDAATGQVLYQKDPRALRAPASLSKMMVELLAMEALRDKKMRLDEYVRVPDDIRSVGGSRVRLRPGEPVTVADLLDATAIASANDAATTLAVRIAGSTQACVALMNRRAHELGMSDTHYENVHGLDRAGEPGNITTAYDLSILARKLLEMPEILRIASTVQTTIRYGQVIHTTNRLLGRCEGVDGLKTGYTGRAGFCLVSTAQREGPPRDLRGPRRSIERPPLLGVGRAAEGGLRELGCRPRGLQGAGPRAGSPRAGRPGQTRSPSWPGRT